MRQQSEPERWTRTAVFLLSAAGLGCQGVLGTSMEGSSHDGAAGTADGVCVGNVCLDEEDSSGSYAGPGVVPMRRLNNAEYRNTVVDMFSSSVPDVTFPEEGRTDGYDTLSTALAVSPLHIESYLDAAEQIVAELFSTDPGGIAAGFCDFRTAETSGNLECARQIVADFAELAWRRPIPSWRDEGPTAEYEALLDPEGAHQDVPLETRLRSALEAVLVSPRFIYRVEFADEEGRLDVPTLASRLSYFLWSSAPDTGLLESSLQEDVVLERELARMQEDPRFSRFSQRFPDMWLQLEKLESIERDPEIYPQHDPQLVSSMAEETRGFFAEYWRSSDATISGLLTTERAPSSSAELETLYGTSPRLGLVTQAAIMTLTGATNRTSPVRRGKWVLERLLCEPPPPPPDALIAELTEELEADESITERERLARHRVDPQCASCHVTMDTIGLGLENYDSIGAYREVDRAGNVIDASGVLPGEEEQSFEGPLELIRLLAEDARLARCVVHHLLTYGTGRTYGREDEPLLDLIVEFAGKDQATLRSVVNGVVLSDAFRRRGEEER